MPSENHTENAGLLLQAPATTIVNKTKIVVHLNNFLISTTTTNQHPQLEEMPYKSDYRSLNTPENTILDMDHFYTRNNIKNSNFVINHNYNSINYINSSEDMLFKESTVFENSMNQSNKKNSDVILLQTKNLHFPITIRPEYEIYQASMDENVYKRHFKNTKKKNSLSMNLR